MNITERNKPYLLVMIVVIAAAAGLLVGNRVSTRMEQRAEEREKLVFRAKLQVDPQLLAKYHRQVKTGVRGLGFVRTSSSAKWPDSLSVKLP